MYIMTYPPQPFYNTIVGLLGNFLLTCSYPNCALSRVESEEEISAYLMIIERYFLSNLHKNLCCGCSLESPCRTYVVGAHWNPLDRVFMKK